MKYQNQILDFKFLIKGNDSDPTLTTETITIKSPRSTASISTYGGTHSNTANVSIWGLSRDDLGRLTQLNIWGEHKSYSVLEISANGSLCYVGTVMTAVADFNKAPDIPLIINCQPAAFLNSTVAKPFSFNGEMRVDEIIKSIVAPFGMTVINNGVTSSLNNQVLQGNPYSQITAACSAVGCFYEISYSSVYISNKSKSLEGNGIYVSPETGLIGYPIYSMFGLTAKTYFNPSYKMSQKIKLDTYLPYATGDYTVGGITHNLSCQMPNGQMESNLILYKAWE